MSTGEVKARVRQQARAKLEQQVHPVHTPPRTSTANCGKEAGTRGVAEKWERFWKDEGRNSLGK